MNEYSLTNYKKIIEEAISLGYEFVGYLDKKKKKQCILRHDMDRLQPSLALKMARIDNKLGIKSTFGIRVDSPFYNPFDKKNMKAIYVLDFFGHDVILHCGIENVEQNFIDLEFELPFVKPIFALHNVGEVLNSGYYPGVKVRGLKNTWNDRMPYMSDSCQRNSPSQIMDFIKVGHPKIHLLLHPEIWE